MADIKLEVSVPTYHEIAGLLEAKGIDISKSKTITLEPGTALVRPIDWRLVQVRRDCVAEATKIWREGANDSFIEFVDKLYDYIVFNKKTELVKNTSDGWSVALKKD